MRHRTCQRLLAAWREGSLTERRAKAVEAHLSLCGACREMAHFEERVVEVTANTSPPPLDSPLREIIKRRITHELARLEEPRERFRLPRLQLAAALAALVLIAALPIWRAAQPKEAETIAMASIVVGEVEYRADDTDTWKPLETGAVLPEGAQVLSRVGGMAAIETKSGAQVSIAPMTAVKFQSSSQIEAEQGVVHASADTGLHVTTPLGSLNTQRGHGEIAVIIHRQGTVDRPGRTDVVMRTEGSTTNWVSPGGDVVPVEPGTSLMFDSDSLAFTAVNVDPAAFQFMFSLEQVRARNLIRANHPSLLPQITQ